MKKILLITDDVTGNENFISELKKKYEVDDVGYLRTAKYKLKKAYDYWLVVIEVSMAPVGLYTPAETDDGYRTGIVFYEKEIKNFDLPVIFWSWSDEYRDEISEFEGRTLFVKKEGVDNHLLESVIAFIGE